MSLFAQGDSIKLEIWSNGSKSKILTLGSHPNGTYNIDTALGEWEIFPSHPPSGFHAALWTSASNEIIWSYKDLVPESDSNFYKRKYKLVCQRDTAPTNFLFIKRLTENPRMHIDSVVLVDEIDYTPFFYKKIAENETVEITNKYLDNIFVLIYFNKQNNSVNDENSICSVYPNPFVESLSISGAKNVEIFDNIGVKRFSKNNLDENSLIDLNYLQDGIYFIKLVDINGHISNKKIVKMK